MPNSLWFPIRTCDYYLGERFLLALDLTLGRRMVVDSLRELHLHPNLIRDAAAEEIIYQVFQSHVPPGMEAKFQELYDRLHGRPQGYETPTLSSATGDRAALIALYNSTGGPKWELNRFWLSEAPLVMWQGVVVSGNYSSRSIPAISSWAGEDRSGDVIGLYLGQNRLTGQLPAALADLSKLQALSMEANLLSGPIPAQLGDLASLQLLDLSGNQLTGPIPPGLGNLSNLQGLWLGSNQLNGPIPPDLARLTNLKSLSLGENSLVGEIPAELGELAYLRELGLGGNRFTGCVPAALAAILTEPEFKYVGLPACGDAPQLVPATGDPADDRAALIALFNITGGPNWTRNKNWATDKPLQDWENVTTDSHGRVMILDLSENGLTGSLPPEMGKLTNLRELWLYGNLLGGSLPPELGRLANLRVMVIRQNQFSGPVPDELGRLTSLQNLDVSENQLSGPIPSQIGNMGALEFVSLSGNQIRGPIPPELGNLSSLKTLKLENNLLTGAIPPQLGNLGSLQLLNLQFNDLSGCIPEGLRGLQGVDYAGQGLATIGFPFCGETPSNPSAQQTDAGSRSSDRDALIAFYRATDGPNWRNNQHWLSDQILGYWAGVGSSNVTGRVLELNLANKNISGTLAPEMGSLTRLKQLNLRGNQLTGPIPGNLGNLAELEVLILDVNQFSGAIPAQLGKLAILKTLFLNNNQLTGSIPPELANLTSLEQLSLGGNPLTGCIPAALYRIKRNDLNTLGLPDC